MDSAVDLLILTGFLSAFYTALALLAALFEWGERLFEAYRGRKPRASRTPKRVAGTRKALREATAWEG